MFTPLSQSQIIYTYAICFASPEFVSIQSMMNCTWLTCEKSSREGFFPPVGKYVDDTRWFIETVLQMYSLKGEAGFSMSQWMVSNFGCGAAL